MANHDTAASTLTSLGFDKPFIKAYLTEESRVEKAIAAGKCPECGGRLERVATYRANRGVAYRYTCGAGDFSITRVES